MQAAQQSSLSAQLSQSLLAAQSYQYGLGSSAQITYGSYAPTAPEVDRYKVSPVRALDKLRKEICDWHGDVLRK